MFFPIALFAGQGDST